MINQGNLTQSKILGIHIEILLFFSIHFMGKHKLYDYVFELYHAQRHLASKLPGLAPLGCNWPHFYHCYIFGAMGIFCDVRSFVRVVCFVILCFLFSICDLI